MLVVDRHGDVHRGLTALPLFSCLECAHGCIVPIVLGSQLRAAFGNLVNRGRSMLSAGAVGAWQPRFPFLIGSLTLCEPAGEIATDPASA